MSNRAVLVAETRLDAIRAVVYDHPQDWIPIDQLINILDRP